MGDRSLPEPNKIVALRQHLHQHAQHTTAVTKVKPVLSHADIPAQYPHINKRDKQKQTKISEQAVIQHNNMILLNKMKSIIHNPTTTLYTPPYQLPSLNYTARKAEFQRINTDNAKLYNKIDKMQSKCSAEKLLADYAQSRTYVANISKFQPHMQRMKQRYTAEVDKKYGRTQTSGELAGGKQGGEQVEEKQNEMTFDSIDTVSDKLHINNTTCIYSESDIPMQHNGDTLRCTLSVYSSSAQQINVIACDTDNKSDINAVTLDSNLLLCMNDWIQRCTERRSDAQSPSNATEQITDILQCFEFVTKPGAVDKIKLQVKQCITDQMSTVKPQAKMTVKPTTAAGKTGTVKSPRTTTAGKQSTIKSPLAKSKSSNTTIKSPVPARSSVSVPQSLHSNSAVQHSAAQQEILSGPLSSLKSMFISKSSKTDSQSYNIQFNVSIPSLPQTVVYPMLAVYSKSAAQPDYTFVAQTERLDRSSNSAVNFVTALTVVPDSATTDHTGVEFMFSLYNASNETLVQEDDIVATQIITLTELMERIGGEKADGNVQLKLNTINADKQQTITVDLSNIVAATKARSGSVTSTNQRASGQTAVSPTGYNVHVSCSNLPVADISPMCALYASDANNEFNYIGQTERVVGNNNPAFSQCLELTPDLLSVARRQLMFTVYHIVDPSKPISESNQLCTTQCITVDDLTSLLSLTRDKQTVVLPLIQNGKLFESAQITLKLKVR